MEVECYVVVHNIAKRHNVGTLARSATAFGVSELILVGRREFNAFGSHGSTSHLRFRHFHSLQDARLYLKERDCDICGVEITDNALPVNHHPFTKSTAFLLGNEGTGLSAKELEICDFFVYIPQYGGGTASLNVTVAASIVLHQFGVWAGFPERTREGNKFIVAEKPVKQTRQSFCAETADSVIEERKCRKEFAANGFFDESGNDNSSSNLLDGLFADFGPERTREGNKFIVAEKPLKQTRRSFCAETADSVIEERKCRKEFAANGFFDESGNDNSSSNLLDGLFADVRI